MKSKVITVLGPVVLLAMTASCGSADVTDAAEELTVASEEGAPSPLSEEAEAGAEAQAREGLAAAAPLPEEAAEVAAPDVAEAMPHPLGSLAAEEDVNAQAAMGLDLLPFTRRPAEIKAKDTNGIVSVVVTPNTWVSPYRGGTGGGLYWIGCAAGEIAVGIYGRSGAYIDQIGLICAYVYSDGSLGGDDWRGSAGGGGGGFFISKCPAGYAIAGFSGRSGAYIDQVQIVCDTIPGTSLHYGAVFGGGGGGPFTDISPYRYFLTQIMGRSGAYVDALQAIHQYVAP